MVALEGTVDAVQLDVTALARNQADMVRTAAAQTHEMVGIREDITELLNYYRAQGPLLSASPARASEGCPSAPGPPNNMSAGMHGIQLALPAPNQVRGTYAPAFPSLFDLA